MRNPSTLIVLPSDEAHATRFCGTVKTFEMALPLSWIEHMRQCAPVVERPATYESGLPVWFARRLYREFQYQDSMTPLMLEGMLLELLAQVARTKTDQSEKHCPPWLRKARDFLHAHFTESFALDAVATAVDVHQAHLTRAFRHHYGCTIGEYIRKLRVEYAAHLLATSALPLSQIAQATGFADQSHFSRTFKSQTGMTPTEYQKVYGHAGLGQKMLT